MSLSSMSVKELNNIYKLNKDTHFTSIVGFNKMDKTQKVKVLSAVDMSKLNMDNAAPGEVVKKPSEKKKEKADTSTAKIAKMFDPKKYGKIPNDIDAKVAYELVKDDVENYVKSLDMPAVKKIVDKYGVIKAIVEYNSIRENKPYIFQQTGNKSVYSKELENDVYNKLCKHIHNDIEGEFMEKIVKLLKKHVSKQNTEKQGKKINIKATDLKSERIGELTEEELTDGELNQYCDSENE